MGGGSLCVLPLALCAVSGCRFHVDLMVNEGHEGYQGYEGYDG